MTKINNMNDYTIMEYNVKTKKYITIGHVVAKNPEEAKLAFLKENPWKPRANVMLFARIPICR